MEIENGRVLAAGAYEWRAPGFFPPSPALETYH